MLIKRVFSQNEEYKDNFKIDNANINKKINEGWEEKNCKKEHGEKEHKHEKKKKGKEKLVKKEKSLIYKMLAVSIIEDSAKIKMKGIVDEKKKVFKAYFDEKRKK
mgnify:CR=1 FL=1